MPFTCAWSGFSLSGIYGTQIVSGEFDPFTSLLGLPFVIGTVLIGGVTLMAVCGKVVVTVRGDSVLGLTKRFKWSRVSSITEAWSHTENGHSAQHIVIEADKRLKLWGLNGERQRYMLAVLNHHKRH